MKIKILLLFLILSVCSYAWAGVENFQTDYDEKDEDSDITLTAGKCDFDTMRRDADSSVEKDFGVAHFGQFDHDFETYFTAYSASYAQVAVYHLSNTDAATIADIDTSNVGITVLMYWDGANRRLILKEWWANDEDNTNIDAATSYYCTIKRDADSIDFEIYNDTNRTDLKDSQTVTFNSGTLRYIGPLGSRDSASFPTASLTGYIQNLDLQEGAPAVDDSQIIMITRLTLNGKEID